jgi:hypothetical protein
MRNKPKVVFDAGDELGKVAEGIGEAIKDIFKK